MDIFDEIKNQVKSDNNTDESKLPWINSQDKLDDNNNKAKTLSSKKLGAIGLGILILIIICFAVFNMIKNNSVSIEKTEASSLDSKSNLSQIQVHVAGEVINPGVYKLDEGSRIMDAVNAAGGFTSKADKNSLNLAKVLEDGEQIMINSIDSFSNASNNTQGSSNNGKININTADLSQLQTLNGVGPATAQKIIDYRNANGKFKSIEDLKKVSGIGDKTFDKFKDQICV